MAAVTNYYYKLGGLTNSTHLFSHSSGGHSLKSVSQNQNQGVGRAVVLPRFQGRAQLLASSSFQSCTLASRGSGLFPHLQSQQVAAALQLCFLLVCPMTFFSSLSDLRLPVSCKDTAIASRVHPASLS